MTATITRDELKAKMDRKEHFLLVEALPTPYYRHTHLPNAINLPPNQVKELAPVLLPDKAAEIIVYCADLTCPSAQGAARELEAMGYTNVRDYAGGKQEWVAAGLPTEGLSRRKS